MNLTIRIQCSQCLLWFTTEHYDLRYMYGKARTCAQHAGQKQLDK